MFSDGNFSYGIEPIGSGEVSEDLHERRQAHTKKILKVFQLLTKRSMASRQSRQCYSISELLYGRYWVDT